MKRPLFFFAAATAALLAITPARAIDVTPGAWADADVTIGVAVRDANDTVVKPGCDCEAGPESGYVKLSIGDNKIVRLHYEKVEGTTVTTTDGTVIGVVLSVQNENANGLIVLVVQVDGGVLGSVDHINLRRNAVTWNGSAPVINTTIDDLRASITAVVGV